MPTTYFKKGSAVLLVDVQQDYKTLIARSGIKSEVCKLLQLAQREGVPIFYIYYTTDTALSKGLPFLKEFKHSKRRLSRKGIPFTWATPPPSNRRQSSSRRQSRQSHTVIVKHGFDAFHGTSLNAQLHKHDVQTVYVAGVCTGYCVLNTMFSAINHGYRIRLVESACADNLQRRHAATLLNYRNTLYLKAPRLPRF
jgi:nicotinamidase-related amidase